MLVCGKPQVQVWLHKRGTMVQEDAALAFESRLPELLHTQHRIPVARSNYCCVLLGLVILLLAWWKGIAAFRRAITRDIGS